MLTTIISFVLILGVIVLVHELGHFITALKLGVDVEEFGIGFPPKIFSIKRKGIVYSLNLIPLGGFVKIKGENGDNNDPRSFSRQASWKKALIISAGVIMNFVTAFIMLSAAFYFGLPQTIDDSIPVDKVVDRQIAIAAVSVNSPAQEQGLQVGDQIVSINGIVPKTAEDVYALIQDNQAEEINLVINRNLENQENIRQEYNITARSLEAGSDPVIGVGIVDTGVVKYGILGSIWQGLKMTGLMIILIVQALYHLLVNVITKGQLSAELAGPVGVAIITGQVVKLGWIYVLQFIAILSINLGIINIFPFPALDGGRLLFIGIEKITRKKINQTVEGWIHNSGFILLIIFILFITYRDIVRYGSQMLAGVKNIF